jgi:predicted ATPase
MRFVVIVGGGGLVESTLVATLRARGHEAVPASPATGVDALTRAGSARRPPSN